MADVLYGFDAGNVVTDASGRPLTNRRATIHTTYTGNSPFTATKNVVAGTLTPGTASAGSVLSDSQGRVGFFATDYYETLWLDYGTGSRWPINITKSSDRTAATTAVVGSGGSNSSGIQVDTDGAYYVAATGSGTGLGADTDGAYYIV